ncbi:MAG: hypothetical protein L3J00_00370 [Thiomicrorhabdus sp.]|nr:hypothetical protein [Thiomicrorhabdus sp.]
MEEIISFIFILFFVEIIMFGFFYSTGYFLTPIVSLGKWKPDKVFKEVDVKVKIKHQSGILLFKKSTHVYLGVGGVIGLGVTFWILVVVLFWVTQS